MVWGLSMTSSFGDFFPQGNYVGWDEELTRYFNEEMTSEQRGPFVERGPIRYIRYVAGKFINECGKKLPELPPFGLIESHEPPQWYELRKRCTSLASFIQLADRLLAVDEIFKNIIERLEPGVHQFFPLQITMPKGEVYPKRYFVMVIGQYLDSFLPDKSTAGCWRNSGNGYYSAFDNLKAYLIGMAFSKDVFGKAHLWRERHMYSPEVLFSDELQAEISNAGLRLPKHYQMKAV